MTDKTREACEAFCKTFPTGDFDNLDADEQEKMIRTMGRVLRTIKPEHTIIVMKPEGAVESITRDAGTFIMVLSLIGVGIWMDSTAMQWLGGGMFIMLTMVKSIMFPMKTKFRSYEELLKWTLDQIPEGPTTN